MLLQRHHSRVCRKTHKSRCQAQRVFKTAPLYAVTNPEESAPQDIWTTFTTFFESLWNPSTNPDGSTVQKAGMSYVYDEDGTLIAQTLTGGAQSSWGQSARYIYLPTASGPMPVAAIYGTKHYAIQSDHLNTPRRLIQSDGQVAWQWAYSAFGDEKPTTAKTRFANAELNQSFGTTSVAAVTFNLRYPGQYFDQESNLHYNLNRSYCPNCGRYTQSDPIDLQGGWNKYSYVGQNPLSSVDPSGLIRWTGSFGGGGAVGPVGASYYKYDLNSECIDGQKARVKGYAIGGSAGIGATITGSTSTTAFEDNESTLQPQCFNGRFAMYGAGLAIGRGGPGRPLFGRGKDNGISWSDVILGNARTASDSNFGTVKGLDLSASFTAGSSIVTSITYEGCGCPK